MKKWWIVLVIALVFTVPGKVGCKGIDKEMIEQKPVNVVEYTYDGIDYGLSILGRLLKTGKPVVMWNKEHGSGGLGLILVEGFLHEKVNLVGGARYVEDKPRYVFWGIEAYLFQGGVLSRLPVGVYWSRDEWWFGISLSLGKISI